jgi:hypothetical protein
MKGDVGGIEYERVNMKIHVVSNHLVMDYI